MVRVREPTMMISIIILKETMKTKDDNLGKIKSKMKKERFRFKAAANLSQ